VLPKQLVTAFRTAKLLNDMQSSSFHQLVLADFLAEGHLDSHLRRMRTLYDGRRATLTRSLRDHFGGRVRISGDEAGMYLLASFQSSLSEDEAWTRAFHAGVRLERLFWPAGVSVTQPGYVQFVFAYGTLSDKELQLVASRLATVLLA
jgi:GntR family transcriptional regulator/MocR family aminotransferase